MATTGAGAPTTTVVTFQKTWTDPSSSSVASGAIYTVTTLVIAGETTMVVYEWDPFSTTFLPATTLEIPSTASSSVSRFASNTSDTTSTVGRHSSRLRSTQSDTTASRFSTHTTSSRAHGNPKPASATTYFQPSTSSNAARSSETSSEIIGSSASISEGVSPAGAAGIWCRMCSGCSYDRCWARMVSHETSPGLETKRCQVRRPLQLDESIREGLRVLPNVAGFVFRRAWQCAA